MTFWKKERSVMCPVGGIKLETSIQEEKRGVKHITVTTQGPSGEVIGYGISSDEALRDARQKLMVECVDAGCYPNNCKLLR